jgi:hypothetical protein
MQRLQAQEDQTTRTQGCHAQIPGGHFFFFFFGIINENDDDDNNNFQRIPSCVSGRLFSSFSQPRFYICILPLQYPAECLRGKEYLQRVPLRFCIFFAEGRKP